MRTSLSSCFLIFGFLFCACGGGASDLGPPTGWVSDGGQKWWLAETDTTGLYRNLETLESMGVRVFEDVDLGPSVQNRLLEFYRSNPELVDSVFVEHGLPIVERGARDIADRTEQRERLNTDAYLAMVDHYRDARPNTEVDAGITYPDSLRNAGVGGRVVVQAYVNEEGEPVALGVIEHAHPTLDALTMQVVTRMRWFSASHDGNPVGSWVRVAIPY